jgi:hypothetical protein
LGEVRRDEEADICFLYCIIYLYISVYGIIFIYSVNGSKDKAGIHTLASEQGLVTVLINDIRITTPTFTEKGEKKPSKLAKVLPFVHRGLVSMLKVFSQGSVEQLLVVIINNNN